MFGIGGFELFIILIFGFLIFGPDKLPEIAQMVGKGIARFREAQQEMNETIGGETLFDPNNPDEPFKNPVEALDRIAQRQEEKRQAKESGAASASGAKKEGASKEKAAGGAGAAGGAVAAGAAGAASADDAARQGSFTERKARYERERAARKAAEAEAAAKAEAGEDAETATATPPVIPSEGGAAAEAEGSRALPDQPAETPAEGGDA